MRRKRSINGMRAVLVWLAMVATLYTPVLAGSRWGCDGLCSGHGYCLEGDTVCRCIEGFLPPDCSQRLCPAGSAWVDYPKADGTAHAELTECSNMGHCDRTTGECRCRPGFTGAACERMLCPFEKNALGLPQECSGQGRCLSMRNAAWEASSYEYKSDDWDANMIHGCVCDPGFEGPACQLRSCPSGDDPASPGVHEIQIIECTCLGACNGSIAARFGRKSTTLPAYATPELLQLVLQRLPGVGDLDVEMHQSNSFCSVVGTATMITFLSAKGDVPLLEFDAPSNLDVAVRSSGQNSTIVTQLQSADGTRKRTSCSHKGACDYETGVCECSSFYSASNGHGTGPGDIQDCGHFLGPGANPNADSCGTIAGVANSTCLNRGVCVDGMCVCDEGFFGPTCEYFECASNFTWFGSDGHDTSSACSSTGVCDHFTGGCLCDTSYHLWEGQACELLACADECSGNGPCLSLKNLGEIVLDEYLQRSPVDYSLTWDADHLQTCHCEYADTADSQDAASNAAYAGPYAGSVPGKKGYNCGRWNCPRGDDITTPGENEIQSIRCSATDGWFYLTFRANRTDPIMHNATAEILKTRLEALRSISTVSVTIEGGDRVCDPSAVTHVEFIADTGALPMLIPETLNALLGNVTVTQTRKGTRERVECSRLGTCDESVGICRCVAGLISSNGEVGVGDRGDCSLANPWTTAYYDRWYGKKKT